MQRQLRLMSFSRCLHRSDSSNVLNDLLTALLGDVGAQQVMVGRVHDFHISRVFARMTKIEEMGQLVVVD